MYYVQIVQYDELVLFDLFGLSKFPKISSIWMGGHLVEGPMHEKKK